MGTVFVVLCCLFAVLFVVLAITMGLRAGMTREWVAVEGRVLSNGVAIELVQDEAAKGDFEACERAFRPDVVYEYAVGSVTHRGSLVAPDMAKVAGSDKFALRRVERHPVDSIVAVHHDPANPARAVLAPGASRVTVGTICAMLVMAALCVTIAGLIANDPPSIPAPDFHTPN